MIYHGGTSVRFPAGQTWINPAEKDPQNTKIQPKNRISRWKFKKSPQGKYSGWPDAGEPALATGGYDALKRSLKKCVGRFHPDKTLEVVGREKATRKMELWRREVYQVLHNSLGKLEALCTDLRFE